MVERLVNIPSWSEGNRDLGRSRFRLLKHWLRHYGRRRGVIDVEDWFGTGLWLRI
tara:strand:- start:127 stop:291 length:165 start_codon:yes stop_codon:yes gene_type:complete